MNNINVPMPKKGCIINDNNKNNTPYVYYATNYYRNDKGKSITERILIGKKDSNGYLIPNSNYFKIFGCSIKVFDKEGVCIYDSNKKQKESN